MASAVANAVAKAMRDQSCYSVGWGDSWVLDQAGDLVRVKIDHPLNRMRAVFQHLERAQDMFEKRHRRSMNSKGAEVIVRVFRLRPEFR